MEPKRVDDRACGDCRTARLGVWCGTGDPFVDSARLLVERTAPPLARLDRGADEPGYLLRGLPEVLGFVGP
ncbi:hypothetical protein GCM10023148_57910 [Actinokineospora soli]